MALNHKETVKHSKRITKIKPLIYKYNWKGTNFPSEGDDLKNLKNNLTNVLNALLATKEKIYLDCLSKHNSDHKKKVILLIITNRNNF